MYFYVDESGHTGSNLFDENQPILYYGLLSSKDNLDVCVTEKSLTARKVLNVKRLHANELGIGELVKIANVLIEIVKERALCFDFRVCTQIAT